MRTGGFQTHRRRLSAGPDVEKIAGGMNRHRGGLFKGIRYEEKA
jgi:hypothetical protein